MFYALKKIWRPWIYQGHTRRDHYFEGWYYKLVDPTNHHILAVIPGIAKNEAAHDTHAFIQVFDGIRNTAHYHRFPVENFHASRSELALSIGPNHFHHDRISLRLENADQTLTGDLQFSPPTPWPVTFFRPGYMGPYAFVPFMQCNHGVLSFDHTLTGSLRHGDNTIDFTGGRSYMEKDWGTSFPGSWIWMQSNHFEESGISWMCSIATIPWLGGQFTGFGAALYLNGSFYPFTTWNRSKIQDLTATKTRTTFTISHRSYRIEIDACGKSGAKLRSPVLGEMADTVLESLQAEIKLRFFLKEKGKWVEKFEGIGQNSGLELSLSEDGVNNFVRSLKA